MNIIRINLVGTDLYMISCFMKHKGAKQCFFYNMSGLSPVFAYLQMTFIKGGSSLLFKNLFKRHACISIPGFIAGTWFGINGQALAEQENILRLINGQKLSVGAGMTTVLQRADDGIDDNSGFSYSADLVIEGDFGDKGSALIYIDTAQGEGVSPNVATGVNADNETGDLASGGYSDTRIAEVWYQFPIGEMTSLKVGKIDPTGIFDANEIANDETTQFLSDSFVNNPAIAFPGYTSGASLRIDASANVIANLGIFESAGDFAGTLDSSFAIGEVDFSHEMGGYPGNFRLIAWNEDSTANKGWAINLDQGVSDTITLMMRYGIQEDTEPFDSALSFGAQWRLGDDNVGAAFSRLAATATGADDESHFEVYYSHAVADHIHITADIQQISNPDFDGNADSVTVYGLRGQIDI